MPKFIVVSQKSGGSFKPLAVAVDEIIAIGLDNAGETTVTLPAPVGVVVVKETADVINRKIRGKAA
jgi:hypothetical protein